ncbi:MAG: nitrilase-related carbon-nitrogen hydrolase [Syntrophaceae bacterium]
MHKRYLNIGMCQPRLDYAIQDNIDKALTMIDAAAGQGAQIAVLPEMFSSPYEPKSLISAAPLTPSALERMSSCARRHEIFIVAGSLPYAASGPKLFNRACVFDPEGRLIHSHDKLHLFDCTPPGGPVVRESETVIPGSKLGVFDTPWGLAAVLVCYDIRFTPLIQILVDRGVRLLFVPAQFSLTTGKAHWEMLLRLRALEIQGVVVGVQPAQNPALVYMPFGHSTTVGPWGEVLMDAGTQETVSVVKVDMDECARIRSVFPLIEHRRTDLYKTVWRDEN